MAMTRENPTSLPDDLHHKLHRSRVVPVVTLHSEADAVPIARALIAGGVHAIEITLRTDASYEGIRRVKAEVPEIALGVGTVLHENQVEFCRDVGVDFLVTPGTTDALYRCVEGISADGHPLVLIPGIATASEAVRALEAGCQVQKFFPAEANGGAPVLKAIGGPLQDLDAGTGAMCLF